MEKICVFAYYAQNNSFYNSINLLISYKISTVLQCHFHNVTVGPRRRIIPEATMAEHACSSLTIKNDNGSEVNSPVDTRSLKVISEHYSVSHLLYYPCIRTQA